MLSEGGEQKSKTNLNFMLEEFGIMVNTGKRTFYTFFRKFSYLSLSHLQSSSLIADSVIRTSYYKYLHPKEALIPNGVLNR